MEQEIPQTSVCKADEAVCGEAALRTCRLTSVRPIPGDKQPNALVMRPSERTQPRSPPLWVETISPSLKLKLGSVM